MAERILITRNDIEDFFPIGKNVPNPRLLQHILRAQQSDLKPFLGQELYFDFVENFTTAANQALFTGGTYTYQGRQIYFGGVRQLLASWAYSRLYDQNPDNITRGGNTRKVTEESDPQDQIVTNVRTTEARSEAIRLQAEAYQFLDQERANYPLWEIVLGSGAAEQTSFSIKKVRVRPLITRSGF